jgi:hypothetical protein
MNFTPRFLSHVSLSGVCARYYEICSEHPSRLDEPLSRVRATEIVTAATGRLSLSKLPGPGTVLQLDGLLPSVMLRFILQGRCSVETDFSVNFDERVERGTLAVLAHAALLHSGAEALRPPYPRPEFHSIDELLVIFQKLGNLANAIASVENVAN